MNRSRILIASASAGTGHLHAAEALRAAVAGLDPDGEVRHVDVLELAPGWLRAAYGGGFGVLAERAPRVWGELYALTDGEACSAPWGPVVQPLLFTPFGRLLAREPWDLVLCTHFLPAQLAAARAGAPPFALVVTDFTIHRYWAQRRVARYFAPTVAAAADLRRRLPGAEVSATGIPIRSAFERLPARGAARARLDLDPDRPTVLVMGGGLGIGVAAAARSLILGLAPDYQIVVLAGSSARARADLDPLAAARPRTRIHGPVNNVHEFMAAADVVVTKPGGVSCSEALAAGRPLVLSRAIPGHEEANAAELVRLGAAFYAPDPAALPAYVGRVLRHPSVRLGMEGAARGVGRADAAATIAALARRTRIHEAA
jgi:processive 1,2-diacylglycerol beta-glucosyltransferase